MIPLTFTLLAATVLFAGAGSAIVLLIRRKNIHLWLAPFLRQEVRRRIRRPQTRPLHLLLCIADHFEPSWGDATPAQSDERIAAWLTDYPAKLGHFRDSDGRPPRHTFFFPIDEYQERHLEALAGFCRRGYGEIEIHLHHDADTAENLHRTLNHWTRIFAEHHGLLGRWPDGSPAYGFIHGNWALGNSRPDGRWCGVCNELDVLRRTGCYADFTMPSAPDPTQTRKINSIYYASDHPGRCKAHDAGIDAGTAPPPPDSLMLIQGPLRLWRPPGSLLPRIENGCIQRSQPPTMARLDQWIRAAVSIPTRPDWVFIKLHTHGATEANRQVLLGDVMVRFHQDLAARAAADPDFSFHYVTAREMYNLAKAAEAGYSGPVAGALDHTVRPPAVRITRIAS